jgi:hypothetical protein
VARLDYGGGSLFIHLSLLERFGASVSNDLSVPLGSVRSVRVTGDVWSELRGVRFPGSGIRGLLALGTRRHPLGRDFVAVYGRGPAVVVELAGAHFVRLVISAGDAQGVAEEIRKAVAEWRAPQSLDR